MYIACAQGVVSPVAYLPKEAIAQGYRVIAEISRGWQPFVIPADEDNLAGAPTQLTVPFYHQGHWEIIQNVAIPSDSIILYVEGVRGKVSVYQDKKLLWRGDTTVIWVPLVGKGNSRLHLVGQDGGILGGIYLLARADTQAWQHTAYPDSVFACEAPMLSLPLSQSLSVEPPLFIQGKCIGYPLIPPARILSVLQKQHHGLFLAAGLSSSWAGQRISSFLDNPFFKAAFALMWVALAVFCLLLPELRSVLWLGLYAPRTVGLIEHSLVLIWLFVASILCISFSAFVVFWSFLLLESLLLEYTLGIGQWAWQSWLVLMAGILVLGLLAPMYVWLGLVGAWGIRVLRFVLYFPKLAYLCSAEAFIGILFLSA